MLQHRFSKTRVVPLRDCTGCSLCTFVCPQMCITMKEGKLGHLFPYVDNGKCVQCNLCVKTCPSNYDISHAYPITAYAAWAKDKEEYVSSTSGGVASVLSREIISKGGVVYGCSMSSDVDVQHIRIDNEEELYKLKGSKYVQSTIKEILPQLKEDVRDEIPVLFIGTPCQVAAVKTVFKTSPSNLFLVDIICHGVPSLSSLRNYLIKKFGRVQFDAFTFRKNGKLHIEIVAKDKIVYSAPYNKDLYYTLFMGGYTYRDSCHQCKYAQPNRVSDITIGDFWGLGKTGDCFIPEHKNGISVMLPLTEKGMSLIQSVRTKLYLYERPIEEAIQGNSQLHSPSLAGKRIKIFQKLEPFLGMRKAYRISHTDILLKNFLK